MGKRDRCLEVLEKRNIFMFNQRVNYSIKHNLGTDSYSDKIFLCRNEHLYIIKSNYIFILHIIIKVINYLNKQWLMARVLQLVKI